MSRSDIWKNVGCKILLESVRYRGWRLIKHIYLFVYVYLRDISKNGQPSIRYDCIAEIHLLTLRTAFDVERKSLIL